MSAHLADTKTQTALTVLLAFGGSSDVQYSIKSLGLGKSTAQELWGAVVGHLLVSGPLPN